MTVARQYLMTAKKDHVDELRDALTALAAQVRSITDCEGVMLFQNDESPTNFTFVELWRSIEAHKAGAGQLPKEALGPVLAALAVPPEAAYLHQVQF